MGYLRWLLQYLLTSKELCDRFEDVLAKCCGLPKFSQATEWTKHQGRSLLTNGGRQDGLQVFGVRIGGRWTTTKADLM